MTAVVFSKKDRNCLVILAYRTRDLIQRPPPALSLTRKLAIVQGSAPIFNPPLICPCDPLLLFLLYYHLPWQARSVPCSAHISFLVIDQKAPLTPALVGWRLRSNIAAWIEK